MKAAHQNITSLRSYHQLNGLIGFIVVAMMVMISLEIFPVQCVYAEMGGCKSCGLTRAFSSALNGSFANMNASFLILFILFAGQLIFRPILSFALATTSKLNMLMGVDIIISASLLVVFIYLMYS